MHKRNLGRTELRVSEISLGTWGLAAESYGPVSRADFREVVEAALDAGVTTFDMAPLWGEGRAETVVSEATASRRDEVVYITRAGAAQDQGRFQHRFDARSLQADCHASLRRLDTEQLDVWLLHNPPAATWRADEWRRAIEDLREAGKIRSWGASVSDAAGARAAISAGAEVICIPYNILAGNALHEVSDDIAEAGCGVLACSPLSYGLLAGKWENDHQFASSDHRATRWGAGVLRERIRQTNMLRFLVHDDVPSLASAALRFVLANSVVTSAVCGARRPDQVVEAAESADGPPYLPEEDLARVSQVLAAVGL